MLLVLILGIFGFFWSLFKYPIPTIIGVNLITFFFFPDKFMEVFWISIATLSIYFVIKKLKDQPKAYRSRNQEGRTYSGKKTHESDDDSSSNGRTQYHTKEKRSTDDPEMKELFRKLAHKYHPDKKGDDEKKFKRINAAYREGDIEALRLFQ